MRRTHPGYFDPQTADRLVVANSLVCGDPEEDGDEEEDEGYSE
jgi:hypothetical protein